MLFSGEFEKGAFKVVAVYDTMLFALMVPGLFVLGFFSFGGEQG